jgi:hypothetical protein
MTASMCLAPMHWVWVCVAWPSPARGELGAGVGAVDVEPDEGDDSRERDRPDHDACRLSAVQALGIAGLALVAQGADLCTMWAWGQLSELCTIGLRIFLAYRRHPSV